MEEIIEITQIVKNEKKIEIYFQTTKALNKYFNTNVFTYESSIYDLSLIPDSILVIPFVANVIPIIWITNSELRVPSLDETFFHSLNDIKKGYQNMYPKISFRGKLSIELIQNNLYKPKGKIVLFSGGIDAICTTLRHINENIELLTLWGSADYPTNNPEIWNIHLNDLKEFANKMHLNISYIKTNFTEFIPCGYRILDQLLKPSTLHWWHDIQHGIGILGHVAPIAFLKQLETVYIASSYDIERQPYTCASDPSIDNFVKYGSTQVIHDGYELNRQDKISYIVQKTKELSLDINVHVCLHQNLRSNCCHCEKCYRTILGLLVEGADPNKFGFNIKDNDINKMIYDIENKMLFPKDKIVVYKQIQRRANINEKNIKNPIIIKWLKSINFERINSSPYKKRQKYITNLKRFIKDILHIN